MLFHEPSISWRRTPSGIAPLKLPPRQRHGSCHDVDHDLLGGIQVHRFHECVELGPGQRDAGQAERRAVAGEDLGEGGAHEGLEAETHERLGRVLARGAAAEVAPDHEDARTRKALVVERMVPLGLFAVVLERVLAQAVEGDRTQVAGGDDAVGVDIIAAQHAGPADDALPLGRHG